MSESLIHFGNAQSEARLEGRQWFIGNFPDRLVRPRLCDVLEMKWGTHRLGESRQWSDDNRATTLSMLISGGPFAIYLPDQEIILSEMADYVLWIPGIPHRWEAVGDSLIFSVRWPSNPLPELILPR